MATCNQLIITQNDSVSVTVVQSCEVDHQYPSSTVDHGEVPVKMRRPWIRCDHLLQLVHVDVVHDETCRRLIHGIKVGTALVLVSLLYLLDVIHDRLGDNSMWAIITVIVMFEPTSGATIGKGVNRSIGTLCGGGLGILAALLAHEIGGYRRTVLVASFLFLFCSTASYIRLNSKIKRRYDYGVMIFILTFSLVIVSDVRGDQIVKVATDRLLAIFMGFAICIFTNLFIFPFWAGDELHASLVSKFNTLASSIEDNLKDYFKPIAAVKSEEPDSPSTSKGCFSILYSKSTDETKANFARWEPWHGRFGFYYPWDKYLEIGEHLRDLAITVLSLRICLKAKQQGILVATVKEQCEATGMLIGSILRALGAHIQRRTRCETKDLFLTKLDQTREDLSSLISLSDLQMMNLQSNYSSDDGSQITCFLLILVNVVDGMNNLVKKIEELEAVAGFKPQ